MKILFKTVIIYFFLILVFSLNPVFAEVGTVTYVLGKVQKKDASGNVTRIRKKYFVDSGDTVITSKNGQAMIVMLDESKITIRPNTEFIVEKYSYRKNASKDKSHFELVKGGFRSVTGVMGKKNKKSFKLKTNIATMGIRGTDFDLSYCETNCSDNKGLFVNVVSGSVSLSSEGGSMDVVAGEIGEVSGAGVAPELVDELPKSMRIGKTDSKGGVNDGSYPSHEEEMVAIALNQDPSNAMFQGLVDEGLPTDDILKGAVSIGMDPTDVVETLLKINPDSDEVLQKSAEAIPEQAGDFTTMGIVLGDVSDQTISNIQTIDGVDPNAVQSGQVLGELIAPRKENKTESEDSPKSDRAGKASSTPPIGEPPRSKPDGIPPIDPELLPGSGTGGGEPPSAS